MIVKMLLIITLLQTLLVPSYGVDEQVVRVLTWWDYISSNTIKDIQNHGYNLDVSIYKSNDVAVSMLSKSKSKFDVAILSNAVINNIGGSGFLESNRSLDIHGRNYHKFLFDNDTKYACVPYLWAITVFMAKASTINGQEIRTLGDLLELKRKGIKVSVMDDKLEVFARMINDYNYGCSSGLSFSKFYKCLKNSGEALNLSSHLTSENFSSGVGDFFKDGGDAGYGSHGSVVSSIPKLPDSDIAKKKKKNRPVIGFDMVCMLKSNRSKEEKEKIKKFIELLTNERNTHYNVEATQYFSPYVDDTVGLRPLFAKLFNEVQEDLKHKKPILITPPDSKYHKIINDWWQGVRY